MASLVLSGSHNQTDFTHFVAELPLVLLQVHNGSDFGKSVSACPKLKSVYGYKLWGLGDAKHKLSLPECKSISLDRSDGLYHLDLTAPKLTELELLEP